MVITEAMACGLPVVSYACPCGPRDIISDGKDGFLVPVNDEKQLADRICYLIEHEDVRLQMGAAAIEKSKQFSLDKIMARWTSLFNSLVNE
jgi:glycosyltransferase involved in cell wall biosynthesis